MLAWISCLDKLNSFLMVAAKVQPVRPACRMEEFQRTGCLHCGEAEESVWRGGAWPWGVQERQLTFSPSHITPITLQADR